MLRTVLHGFWLPLSLARAVLGDSRVRRRWLRYSAVQALATTLIAVALLTVGGRWFFPSTAREGSRAAEAALADVQRAVEARADALTEGVPEESADAISLEAAQLTDRLDSAEGEVVNLIQAGDSEEVAFARVLRAALDGKAPEPRTIKGEPKRRRRAGSLRVADAGVAEPSILARDIASIREELRRAALDAEGAAEARILRERPLLGRLRQFGRVNDLFSYAAAFWGALYTAQLIVLALFRDHHDALSREACLLARIEPEDPEMTPRIRLSWKWARSRLKRALRGWIAISVGLPIIWAITLPFPRFVRAVLIVAWLAYWEAVFAAAKSDRAWTNEDAAPEPWFIRGYRWLVERVVLFWWGVPRLYGRIWRRMSRGLFAPAECVEQQPLAFAGLAAFRLLSSVPLVKIFARPLVPVASAMLVESYRQRLPPRSTLSSEP